MQSKSTDDHASEAPAASFWDASWKSLPSERLEAYRKSFDRMPDETIALLHRFGVRSVCDAGCGCGIYAWKLAENGFCVSGFDISAHAVALAQTLLENASCSAALRTASILDTGYPDSEFDCVLSRDVIDHLRREDAAKALRELCRITRPGGLVLFTLDPLDEEYQTQPHVRNENGDYLYTAGKWNGMVFHPYSRQEISALVPADVSCTITERDGILTVLLQKPA